MTFKRISDTMDLAIFRDPTINLEAKAVYAMMHERNDESVFTAERLARETVETAAEVEDFLQELVIAGYIALVEGVSTDG